MKSENHKKFLFPLFVAALMLAACSGPDQGASAVGAAPDTEPDTEALRNELLQADKAFSLLSLDQGVEKAYLRYLDDTAVQLPDGGMPLKGKLAIMANVKASVGDMEFSLSWEPVDVQVSLSGDLGYTWGYYYLEATGEDGELYAAEGKYASVWRHRAEQGWQVVLDTSNQNEPPYLDELEFDLPVE